MTAVVSPEIGSDAGEPSDTVLEPLSTLIFRDGDMGGPIVQHEVLQHHACTPAIQLVEGSQETIFSCKKNVD